MIFIALVSLKNQGTVVIEMILDLLQHNYLGDRSGIWLSKKRLE